MTSSVAVLSRLFASRLAELTRLLDNSQALLRSGGTDEREICIRWRRLFAASGVTAILERSMALLLRQLQQREALWCLSDRQFGHVVVDSQPPARRLLPAMRSVAACRRTSLKSAREELAFARAAWPHLEIELAFGSVTASVVKFDLTGPHVVAVSSLSLSDSSRRELRDGLMSIAKSCAPGEVVSVVVWQSGDEFAWSRLKRRSDIGPAFAVAYTRAAASELDVSVVPVGGRILELPERTTVLGPGSQATHAWRVVQMNTGAVVLHEDLTFGFLAGNEHEFFLGGAHWRLDEAMYEAIGI